MRRFFRWLGYGLLTLLILAVLAGVGAYIWQRGSLPRAAGEITLPGLQHRVQVERDADGLVTIVAENERDALFALGFVHAQDRLFQMDLTRRLGAGRLSEVVGASTLSLDRVMRTLGLARVAEANVAQLSVDALAALEAYADGVNAFLEHREGPLPLEFTLLGYEPAPWRPADSLVWGRLMALQLSGNYSEELLRARLAQRLSPDAIRQLYPDYPADAPVGVKDYAALEERGVLTGLAEALPWEVGPKSASNAWALSPTRSTTGGALLANDPHLSLQAPGYWYLARIELPGRTLVGATAPGVPYVVIGRNDDLAWTFTTTHSDTQDLFIETIDPADPTRYLTREGSLPFKTREERIEVAGGEAEVLTVRETYHGVVISDAVESARGAVPNHQVLALAWPALLEDDRSGEALYRLNLADGVPAAIAALRDLQSPQQTMLLADTEGRIALVAPARVPIRAKGDGTLPVPGATGEYDWTGFIRYEDLPQVVDPPDGVLIAANNKLVDDSYPFLIAKEWYFPQRAERIAEVLAEKERWSPEEMQALQNDVLSVGARQLLPRLLEMVGDKPEAAAALDLLRRWDFVMDRAAPQPLIYSAWIRALERRLLQQKLGDLFSAVAGGNERRLLVLIGPDSLFCGGPGQETCEHAVDAALDEALSELVKLYGEDAGGWRWGKAHVARFDHPVLGYVPFAAGLVAYEVETSGGQDTVNRGGSPFGAPLPQAFQHRHGAGLRIVFDLADFDATRMVIATGQSGNLLSPHYGDFAERWRDGAAVFLVGGGQAGTETLVLNPAE